MIGEIIGLLQSPIQRLISALENKEEAKGAKTEEAPAVEVLQSRSSCNRRNSEAPAAEGEAPAAE